MKRIPYRTEYLGIEKRPMKVNERNADGEVVWEQEPDLTAPEGSVKRAGTPKLKVADTYELLKEVVRTLGAVSSIAKAGEDPRRSTGIFIQVEEAQERLPKEEGAQPDKDVRLGEQSYTWLHGVLNRTLPLHQDPLRAKEMKERGDQPLTFTWYLWREDSWLVQNALRDPEADKAHESDVRKIGKED